MSREIMIVTKGFSCEIRNAVNKYCDKLLEIAFKMGGFSDNVRETTVSRGCTLCRRGCLSFDSDIIIKDF